MRLAQSLQFFTFDNFDTFDNADILNIVDNADIVNNVDNDRERCAFISIPTQDTTVKSFFRVHCENICHYERHY